MLPPAWPDVDIKSSPKFSKSYQKIAFLVFTENVTKYYLSMSQWVPPTLLKKIVDPYL